MATITTKPAPEQRPFKAAKEEGLKNGEWQPMATAPKNADARFMVRATAGGKGVKGTETIVRYRTSRKMVGRKWQPSLVIIDDRLSTKLGFRPTEWKELPQQTNA
jgi:hypothetical protein